MSLQYYPTFYFIWHTFPKYGLVSMCHAVQKIDMGKVYFISWLSLAASCTQENHNLSFWQFPVMYWIHEYNNFVRKRENKCIIILFSTQILRPRFYWFMFSCIYPKYRKIRTRENSLFKRFVHSVEFHYLENCTWCLFLRNFWFFE